MAGTYWFQLIFTSFGWHVIPTGHFPQKSLSKNPKIGFFPFPTARPCSLLPLTHDPPLPILAGYKLVVPRSCACFTFFVCCSCIYRDLEIGLYVLPCIFGFLWRGLFSDLPFFMNYFFLGWPCRIMGLSSPGLLCIHSVALLAFPAIPLCYSCCNVIWLNHVRPLWACCLFPSQWLSVFTGPFLTLFAGSCVPFPSWASLAHLLSLSFLGPFPILLSHGSLLILLGSPGPITLYLIIGANRFSINLLLTSCSTYYPWVCFFSLSRPIEARLPP